MTPYDPLDACTEFDFVHVHFVPHTAPDKGEDDGAEKGPKTTIKQKRPTELPLPMVNPNVLPVRLIIPQYLQEKLQSSKALNVPSSPESSLPALPPLPLQFCPPELCEE